jgi:cystathionine beta-lyase/cystathionine gamma-synthase
MKKETRVTHPPEVKLPDGNRAVVAPIYRSVKFTFDEFAQGSQPGAFHYSRRGNPTLQQLEMLLSELQGQEAGVAVASGMAAVSLSLLGSLRSGDHNVIFIESYKPTRTLVRNILPRYGITHSLLSVMDLDAMEEVFAQPETCLVFFEAPTNPMRLVPDIAEILKRARRHDVTSVLDNTFAGFHNHGQYPADLFVHSLTKYASGHGDVMGGVVLGSNKQVKRLRPFAGALGPVLDPETAFMILRGMKTYSVRYAQQCANAQRLAQFLEADSRVREVRYPGLPDDPGHGLATQQMQDFGGIVGFDIEGAKSNTLAFVDALKLFTTSASLGSTESLVAPVKIYWADDLDADELVRAGITDTTLRFAVGLEHIDDLLADVAQALDKAITGD